jgi:predicted nucleic acid-binding protein
VSRIFWDTNLFIYLMEGSGEKSALVRRLLDRMVERHDELLTSTLTLGEVLVKPLEMGAAELAHRYERLMDRPGVSLIRSIRKARGPTRC